MKDWMVNSVPSDLPYLLNLGVFLYFYIKSSSSKEINTV